MGRDHRDQPQFGLSHHRRRPADDARGRLGPHHQHRLGPWPDGEPLQIGLYRGQARDRGADQDHGAGDGGGADHRQRDLPGLRADPAGGGADPRHDEGIRHEPGGRDPQRDADAPAVEGIRHGRADGRHGGLPVFRRGGADHRDDDQRRWGWTALRSESKPRRGPGRALPRPSPGPPAPDPGRSRRPP
jgi:hypothetical protein